MLTISDGIVTVQQSRGTGQRFDQGGNGMASVVSIKAFNDSNYTQAPTVQLATPPHPHAVLPVATLDELSRQNFVKAFKMHLANKVIGGNRLVYEQIARPQFEKQYGYPPRNRQDVHSVMDNQPYYNFWGALQRTSQEMCWDSVLTSVNRQLPELIEKAKPPKSPLGTLKLDPSLEIPRYLNSIDIHCLPGSYYLETCENDVAGGAVYDRGIDIYSMGSYGPLINAKGQRMANFVKDQFPTLAPRRILDMGCTVGNATLAYVDAFKDAEVYGIDLGAPLLRYAHARAESLGRKIHFSQQNAEQTNFPDGYFDLIVSTAVLHETSSKALPKILKENFRLLRPGGVVVHAELQSFGDVDAFEAFMLDWDLRNNNEPFWGALREHDPKDLMIAAGFNADKVFKVDVQRATPYSKATNRKLEVNFGAVR